MTERDPEWVFYDGTCGLCHGVVRFIARRDRSGELFRFAPLDGPTFRSELSDEGTAEPPDSVAVKTSDGRMLFRSEAALHVGRRLGGVWRVLATAGRLVPAWVLDLLYDGVATIRRRLFGRPDTRCPVVPEHMRSRFYD